MKSIAIIGAGGMARDALVVIDALGLVDRVSGFFESDEYWSRRVPGQREMHGLPIHPLSSLDTTRDEVVIAVGSGLGRETIASALPSDTRYPTLLHPSVIRGRAIELGQGVLICAGAILTTDIRIGDHTQINVACSITHDCRLADFVTLSPAVRLSGNCTLGRQVFVGTGACIREKVTIVDGATIGMGAVVTRPIDTAGIWMGCPARKT